MKKHTLEQSIEKTIDILGKLDIEDFEEFNKYQIMLNNYCILYKNKYVSYKPKYKNDNE